MNEDFIGSELFWSWYYPLLAILFLPHGIYCFIKFLRGFGFRARPFTEGFKFPPNVSKFLIIPKETGFEDRMNLFFVASGFLLGGLFCLYKTLELHQIL